MPDPPPEAFELPTEEVDKLRKVLRLSSGAPIAVLPGDGRLLRCELDGHDAVVKEILHPATEPKSRLTLCLALPKPERLEEAIRMGTEIGAASFVVFPSERSVVRWDEGKRENRLKRLRAIAREAAEVCFRTHLPTVAFLPGLKQVIDQHPEFLALSEWEGATRSLQPSDRAALLVGPEGGWAPPELARFGDRQISLGPRVLRVDTAVSAAASLFLLGDRATA